MKYLKIKLSIFTICMNVSLSPSTEQLNEWNISFNNALAGNQSIERVQVVGSSDLPVEGGFTFGAGTSFEGGTGGSYGGGSGGSNSNNSSDDAEGADSDYETAVDNIVTLNAIKDAITSELSKAGLNDAQKIALGNLLEKVNKAMSSTNTYLGIASSVSQTAIHIAKGEAIEATAEVSGYLVGLGASTVVAATLSGVSVPIAAVFVGTVAGSATETGVELLIREIIIPLRNDINRAINEIPSSEEMYCAMRIRRPDFCNMIDDR